MKNYFFNTPFIILIIPLLFIPIKNVFASDYYSIKEYHAIHPEQKEISNRFTEIVMANGKPIKPGIQKQPVKISFIYPGEQVSDYWRRSIVSFMKRMKELTLKYDLREHFSKPVVDYRIQEKQIKKALAKNPDYLVFTLDVKKHKGIIERIIIKRRPKLILQNITTPLKSWEGKQPFLYVGFDHATGSELIADYLITKTGGEGRYAMLYFSRGYVSEMRGDTFSEYVKNHSALKLVSSYYTNGDKLRATQATRQILNEHAGLKFIFACSTDVALGAIDGLQEQGPINKVIINGWGGGSSELEAIQKQIMDVTVMRMNDDNGVAMAEAIKLDIQGRKKKVPLIFSGDFALIEKNTPPDMIQVFKKRAFRYSGAY